LLLLGEALGETEVRKLRPFVGDAGWFLDDVLRTARVPRSDCYVMNVVPTRPPENKLSRLGELGLTLGECEEWARGRIAELRPNCVLALGEVALKCLTGQSGITDWRGSILEADVPGGNKVKVVSTFHPSYVKRMGDKTAKKEREGQGSVKYTYGSARLSMAMDARRAWKESQSPELTRLVRDLIVSPTLEKVRSYLTLAKQAKRASFDVETKGKWIDCVGISAEPSSAICVPRGEAYWGPRSDEVENLLREFLWTHTGLVAQNGAFDLTMLLGNGLPVRWLSFDTMIAHHFLHPELPHDLHYLTSVYTKEPFYKWMLKGSKK
jgi:uracil-DNA glycosylase family 4